MMNLFNYTDKEFSDTVDGKQVVIRPFGSTQVSERVADSMIKRNPGVVGKQPFPQYSDEDVKVVKQMNKPELLDFTLALMNGSTEDPAAYMEPQQGDEGQNEGQNTGEHGDGESGTGEGGEGQES